jgi:hypothetical protein
MAGGDRILEALIPPQRMNARLFRRGFLKACLAGAAWPLGLSWPARPAGAQVPADSPTEGLSAYQLGPQIWLRWNNRLLTCYRAHASQKYPYLYPLSGPLTGLSLTAETALPWPHHRSVFFGCDRVNGGNYWQEEFGQGQILSTAPRLGRASRDGAEILDACEWKKPGEPAVMKDSRKIRVTVPSPRWRFIDWEIEWQAVQDVTILKTNHSLFSVRAAVDLAPSGGGQLRNAEGATGEKATFGQPSAWCDFSGRRGGAAGAPVEGITLMDHPKNPWAPTRWFTRDYGFMSPTPFQFIEQPWTMAAGKSVVLRYRLVLHAGDAMAAGVGAIYKAWAEQGV